MASEQFFLPNTFQGHILSPTRIYKFVANCGISEKTGPRTLREPRTLGGPWTLGEFRIL